MTPTCLPGRVVFILNGRDFLCDKVVWHFGSRCKLRIFENDFFYMIMKTVVAYLFDGWCRKAHWIFATLMLVMAPMAVSAGDMAGGQDHRWEICDDGSIMWVVDDAVPHYDHIEMSGESVSLYLQLCSGYA